MIPVMFESDTISIGERIINLPVNSVVSVPSHTCKASDFHVPQAYRLGKQQGWRWDFVFYFDSYKFYSGTKENPSWVGELQRHQVIESLPDLQSFLEITPTQEKEVYALTELINGLNLPTVLATENERTSHPNFSLDEFLSGSIKTPLRAIHSSLLVGFTTDYVVRSHLEYS